MRGKDRARLRREGQGIDATLEVGKAGLSETLVVELRRQLEDRPLVKVQIRRSAAGPAEAKGLAEELAVRSGAVLVELRGKAAVYARGGSSRD